MDQGVSGKNVTQVVQKVLIANSWVFHLNPGR